MNLQILECGLKIFVKIIIMCVESVINIDFFYSNYYLFFINNLRWQDSNMRFLVKRAHSQEKVSMLLVQVKKKLENFVFHLNSHFFLFY